MNELPVEIAVDRDGKVAYPLLYPAPRGYIAIGYRHYTSELTTWSYAAGWSAKLVYSFRESGKFVVQWRIPKTPTYLLLIQKKDMPHGH